MAVDPQYRQMMLWVLVALVVALLIAGVGVALTLRYVEPLA
jgi:hypothetical protein